MVAMGFHRAAIVLLIVAVGGCDGGSVSTVVDDAAAREAASPDGRIADGDVAPTDGATARDGGAMAMPPRTCSETALPTYAEADAAFVIAPGGDDRGAGTVSEPLATVAEASRRASPGDLVLLRGGEYRQSARITRGGSVDAPITFAAYPGERPIFDGSGLALDSGEAIIAVAATSHVVLDGFEIHSSSGRGISIYDADSITVRRMDVHHTQYRAVGGQGEHLVFEDNHIHDAVLINEDSTASSGWPAALSVWIQDGGAPSRDITIRGNHIHDVWGECVIALFAEDVVVEGNELHDCFSVGVYVDTSRRVRIERNAIYTTTDTYARSGRRMTGISMAAESYDHPRPDVGAEDLMIANNLLFRLGSGIGYWGDSSNGRPSNRYRAVTVAHNVVWENQRAALRFDASVGDPAADCLLVNNVLAAGSDGGARLDIAELDAWSIRNNDFPGGVPDGVDSSNLEAIPSFEGGGSADPDAFRIATGSSLDGAGVAVPSVSTDFFCSARDDVAPAIGLHEP